MGVGGKHVHEIFEPFAVEIAKIPRFQLLYGLDYQQAVEIGYLTVCHHAPPSGSDGRRGTIA
jgi:hypothetical protein